jgi:hypothetical protein
MLIDIIKQLVRLFYIIIGVVLVYILLLNVFNYSNGCVYSVLGWMLLLFAFVVCKYHHDSYGDHKHFFEKNVYLFHLISFVVMIFFAFNLRVDFSWDYGEIFSTAFQKASNQEIERIFYLARYPNNSLIFWVITKLCSIVLFFNPNATINYCNDVAIIVNCVIIQVSMLVFCQGIKIGRGERHAYIASIIMLGCLPVYAYAAITYTDTIGLLPLSLVFVFYELYLKLSGLKKWVSLAFCTIAGMVGFFLKPFVLIPVIAIVISIILKAAMKKTFIAETLLVLLVCSVGFSGTYVLMKKSLNSYMDLPSDLVDACEFPKEHWIMMTLNPETDGGYNENDFMYTWSYPTLQEKKEADIQMINIRLSDMGVSGVLKRIFVKKWKRTWTNCTFAADDYISRFPQKYGLLQEFFTIDGQYHMMFLFLSHMWWLLVLTFMLIAVVYFVKDRECNLNQTFVYALSFVGLLLFLSVWECNSRYIFVYLPIFAMWAADGYVKFVGAKVKKEMINGGERCIR